MNEGTRDGHLLAQKPAPRWFTAGLPALGGIYLLQTASPLRLDHDAVKYLRIAVDMQRGIPTSSAEFPPGYPLLVTLLDIAGLASSASFIFVNCLFIGLALFAIARMPGRWSVNSRRAAIVLTLLSYPVIRSVAMPLSDAVFLGACLASVAAMCAAFEGVPRNRRAWLLAATLMAGTSISFRLAGVALLPALAFAFIRHAAPAAAWRTRHWVTVALAIAGSVVIAAAVSDPLHGTLSQYAEVFRYFSESGLKVGLIDRGESVLTRVGELLINLPHSQFDFVKALALPVGLAGVGVLCVALAKVRRVTPAGVFVASYLTVLFAWPLTTSRLWLPLIPILILFLADGFSAYTSGLSQSRTHASRLVRIVARAHLVLFILAGVAAIGWTTRISLSGDKFPSLYGSSGGMASPGFETANPTHNTDARMLIERFDGGRR